MLVKIRDEYGFNIITEVKDSSHVDAVIEHADIVQIGAKAMYDQSILQRCGESDKPVLLKRGFGTTLQEFVQYFHSRAHYPTLEDLHRYLGSLKDNGAYHLLSKANYEMMRRMLPASMDNLYDAGVFDAPEMPFYFEPKDDL